MPGSSPHRARIPRNRGLLAMADKLEDADDHFKFSGRYDNVDPPTAGQPSEQTSSSPHADNPLNLPTNTDFGGNVKSPGREKPLGDFGTSVLRNGSRRSVENIEIKGFGLARRTLTNAVVFPPKPASNLPANDLNTNKAFNSRDLTLADVERTLPDPLRDIPVVLHNNRASSSQQLEQGRIEITSARPPPDASTVLSSIREDETSSPNDVCQHSLNSTQQLRSGFFRTIKKHYPLLEELEAQDNSTDSGRGDSLTASEDGSPDVFCEEDAGSRIESPQKRRLSEEDGVPSTFLSSMARKRLADLRKVDPHTVDVPTGLLWIRLELHEMREQDKALFLQLIKLHGNIKDLRSDMNCNDNDSECSYDDMNDAPSLWWPRYSSTISRLPNFSSSDGAQMLRRRRHPELRRGVSLNYQRPQRFDSFLSSMTSVTDERVSCRSSTSSVRSASAC